MMEYRLFNLWEPPEWLDPEWWRDRPHCNHLESDTGAHTARLRAAANAVDDLVGRLESVPLVADLGAGDGALLSLLDGDYPACGFEIIEADVVYAQRVRHADVSQLNVLTEDWHTKATHGWIDGIPVVAVCTEFLEHQRDPHGFLRDLAGKADYVVASSPYGETLERHEWNHAWAWDTTGYAELFGENGWEVLDHTQVEWSQLIVAKAIGADPGTELTTEEAVAALEDANEHYGQEDHFIENVPVPDHTFGGTATGPRPDPPTGAGIIDLDPYVETLLAAGREAGLP